MIDLPEQYVIVSGYNSTLELNVKDDENDEITVQTKFNNSIRTPTFIKYSPFKYVFKPSKYDVGVYFLQLILSDDKSMLIKNNY